MGDSKKRKLFYNVFHVCIPVKHNLISKGDNKHTENCKRFYAQRDIKELIMQTLICQAADCVYNDNKKCSANVIHVNVGKQETFCDTYTKADSFVANEAGNMPHLTDNISDAEFGCEFVDSPRISCTAASCVYNKSFRCKAKGVEIDDPHDSIICNCNTYRPK